MRDCRQNCERAKDECDCEKSFEGDRLNGLAHESTDLMFEDFENAEHSYQTWEERYVDMAEYYLGRYIWTYIGT